MLGTGSRRAGMWSAQRAIQASPLPPANDAIRVLAVVRKMLLHTFYSMFSRLVSSLISGKILTLILQDNLNDIKIFKVSRRNFRAKMQKDPNETMCIYICTSISPKNWVFHIHYYYTKKYKNIEEKMALRRKSKHF